ncbi:ABL077Wp [Eremothecium gossypii ATCC 10895]|uniref:Sulfite reductase [NADPH] subunit beta n=1 Tax=Eremothecium gossypii (strain ATCC 10895 / CBS 109.51 / FGSC 9923 / NRRL Y-1056) TaxID=284811 RepID=Q75DV0_EREGS|nr:ABL077Wp [Eremothecium gossypii ATCC 10895]AAS50694.2 ABL077Wp [Eremothecium gossypii ATCC 10895]AEY94982.1 FABL077Wp [Eremothecium gossypii FDAG1]
MLALKENLLSVGSAPDNWGDWTLAAALVRGAADGTVFYTARAKASRPLVAVAAEQQGVHAIRLLAANDPFCAVTAEAGDSVPATVFTDLATVITGAPHLATVKTPIVVHIETLAEEYAAIPGFKDLGSVILVSSSPSQLLRAASTATKLAQASQRPVLHFYTSDLNGFGEVDVGTADGTFDSTIEDAPERILDSLQSRLVSRGTPSTLILNLSAYGEQFAQYLPDDVALYDITVYKPFEFSQVLRELPVSVKNIAVVQGSTGGSKSNGFEPILLDVFSDFNLLVDRGIKNIVVSGIGRLQYFAHTLEKIVSNSRSLSPSTDLYISDVKHAVHSGIAEEFIKKAISLENAYLSVLQQVFEPNLQLLNQFNDSAINSLRPEYGFGKFLQQNRARRQLMKMVERSLDCSLYEYEGPSVVEGLAAWISYNKRALDSSLLKEANILARDVHELLQKNSNSEVAKSILASAPTLDSFSFSSSWLIGSDAWSYDLGNSGVHHAITSRENINILLIDSEPYGSLSKNSARKKDVGLYAMNFGTAYVASVAVYSSYTQLLTAVVEASRFPGPSIVLAYLPYNSEQDSPLTILKETKRAVESGYWPLYRYNPTASNEEDTFKLDSSVLRRQLQEFLDRENKLTLLAKRYPDLSSNIVQSQSDIITAKQQRKSKEAYDQLLQGLSGPPLSVYYASDGGNAASLAKILAKKATTRGLKSFALSMDDIVLEDLPREQNVVFITSTGGQGEFPQDGKAFWEELKSATDLDLASVKFSVFGLGDSQYWPRKEDERYYNKPGKDLYNKLLLFSGQTLIPLGLGDDQDPDGYRTGYEKWESELWAALGVSDIITGEEPKLITNEDIKLASNFLRGTIAEALVDDSTGSIPSTDQQLTKFHGIYMQDDRDIRDVRKAQGLEPYYIFMIRARLPGGIARPEQYLALDKIAASFGNNTIKLTTRATFQLHGVVKRNLKSSIRAMNSTLLDTLAACGDVNRNVMVSALPANARVHEQVANVAAEISEELLPNTTAYHEIWLEGPDRNDASPEWQAIWEGMKSGPKKKVLVGGNALQDIEPIYGPTYLPRKFKVNIAVPPYNDVDVWACDVGLIAIIDETTSNLVGFNVYVGGGMGTTHNNKKTYPRLGSSFGFAPKEDITSVVEKILLVQRDHGDRTNRKHARLKYTIDDMGIDIYRQKVEELWGDKFAPERSYKIESNIDYFGWVKDETGMNHFTAFIENGRIEDSSKLSHKTGLRKVAEYMKQSGSGHFRLTGNQHIVISAIPDQHLDAIKGILKAYKLDNYSFSGLRLASSACVAFPTCGLAMAESERYLPQLISRLEESLEEYGLRHDSVVMRMSGCPNGCSRPWVAEVACVGKAPGTYNLLLGGGYYGQRLNKLYRSSLKEAEILSILRPLFKRWSLEREESEHFGDFLIRVGVIKPTLEGRKFHDDLPDGAI